MTSTLSVSKIEGLATAASPTVVEVSNGHELHTNTLKGTTTAGSINVQGEGTATTNLQQGLAKCHGRFSATQFNDSFNMSSFTDNSQGNHTLNFNNDMANTNYTNSYASEGGSDVFRYIWEDGTNTGSTLIKTYYFRHDIGLTQADFADNSYTNHGDLA